MVSLCVICYVGQSKYRVPIHLQLILAPKANAIGGVHHQPIDQSRVDLERIVRFLVGVNNHASGIHEALTPS